ncbi:MAG TPA: PilZ domain-containing protein [Paucimonas sp.]|nr:PilZ domain-containing protein [Paucimonas sp.]
MDINHLNHSIGSTGRTDQRLSPRKILRVDALLSVEGAGPRPVRTADISSGGLSIVLSRQLAIGQKVKIAFELTARGRKRKVVAIARVVHCSYTLSEGYRCGLHFLQAEDDAISLIALYMKG